MVWGHASSVCDSPAPEHKAVSTMEMRVPSKTGTWRCYLYVYSIGCCGRGLWHPNADSHPICLLVVRFFFYWIFCVHVFVYVHFPSGGANSCVCEHPCKCQRTISGTTHHLFINFYRQRILCLRLYMWTTTSSSFVLGIEFRSSFSRGKQATACAVSSAAFPVLLQWISEKLVACRIRYDALWWSREACPVTRRKQQSSGLHLITEWYHMYDPECLYNHVGGFMEPDIVLNFQYRLQLSSSKKGKLRHLA